jgi:hypothetical protein
VTQTRDWTDRARLELETLETHRPRVWYMQAVNLGMSTRRYQAPSVTKSRQVSGEPPAIPFVKLHILRQVKELTKQNSPPSSFHLANMYPCHPYLLWQGHLSGSEHQDAQATH